MSIKENSLYFKNRDEWRKWLEENHDSMDTTWLIFYKKHTEKPTILYEEAVEEAICFGWIDSIKQRLDNERYLQKFTVRKDLANWSEINKSRFRKMVKKGKMTSKGIEKFKPDDSKTKVVPEHISSYFHPDFKQALAKHEQARNNWDNLAESYQKRFLIWINMAKKDETRKKRVKESIKLLKKGRKLGLK